MKLSQEISAVVTGGASGLGEGTARFLASKGVKVGVFDMNVERGERVAAEIGGTFAAVDVSNSESVDAGFSHVRAAHGQERILVNCAGIGGGMKTASRDRKTGKIRAHDSAFYVRIIQINLIGTFLCASKSAAGMMSLDPLDADGERGVVINTSSVAAQDGQVGQLAYVASKGGVLAMALPMARDLAPEGIRVNTILPGFFETPILEPIKEEVKQSLRAHLQFPNRFGKPHEYAQIVAMLCEQVYINAEYIRVDAGVRMPPR